MSDLTKNKPASALVWAAFFAFWFHSLHCCQACESERGASDARCPFSICDATDNACDVFHRTRHFSAPFRRGGFVALKTPTLDRRCDAERPICGRVCPSLRLGTEKQANVRFVPHPSRTFFAASPSDARFLSADAFSTRFADALPTPLYLRLRKLLN